MKTTLKNRLLHFLAPTKNWRESFQFFQQKFSKSQLMKKFLALQFTYARLMHEIVEKVDPEGWQM